MEIGSLIFFNLYLLAPVFWILDTPLLGAV